ncbi:MAG: DUF2066 domain-containing protein [Gammaproteobacteria bacterium]|jgi:hypothetical protein|nr:DUF2066 domain-containing protein [Gammaproteobacteria bacterium]MDC3342949.1 DUF2066 domain-containing protein [Pseudomonadales bacterium]
MFKKSIPVRRVIAAKSSLTLLVLLLVVAQKLDAVTLENLYQAEVLSESQSDAQRRIDASEGLSQVLTRVSGRSDILQNPVIVAALKTPEQYYSEFSYARVEAVNDAAAALPQPGLDPLPAETPRQVMRIRFAPSLIAKILREADLPVWGSNRPSVLSWMAIDDESGRQVLGEANPSLFAKTLNQAARARGVPLLLPLWDLEDSRGVSSSEIWGRFLGRIEAASKRYSPDKILVFRAESEFSNQWRGDWSLGEGGQWRSGTVYGESQAQLATALVGVLASVLSEQYAVTSTRSEVRLTVEGITEIQDYAEVSRYLEGLTQVMSVQPVRILTDMVEFKLRSEGEVQQIIDVIALDRKLSLLRLDESSSTLWYRWAP